MMITLDNLAHRYHCLPSEALARATTLDLHCLDISVKWELHKHEQSNSGQSTPKPAPKLSEQEMLDMVKRVREKK